MNTEPETIAAIIADYRADIPAMTSGELPHPTPEYLRILLDRIEAAVERERAITDAMLAVKDKPLPHPDPDTAPPLFFPMTKTQLQTLSDLVAIAHDEMDGLPRHEQELERFDSLLFDMKARYAFDKPYAAPGNAAALREALEEQLRYWNSHVRTRDEEEMRKRTEAALSAPARNCDRFAVAEEAVVAFADHLRAWENAHGIHSEYPDHPVQVPAGAFVWLFAPAKGEAK